MPAPWTCLRIVVSDGSVKKFISVTWHPAGLRGPQARVKDVGATIMLPIKFGVNRVQLLTLVFPMMEHGRSMALRHNGAVVSISILIGKILDVSEKDVCTSRHSRQMILIYIKDV